MERYSDHSEYDQRIETRRTLSTLDRLLAKLIESGPELDPRAKAQLRQSIRQLLGNLGLQKPEDLLEAHQRYDIEIEFLPTPPQYPTKQEFQRNLLQVVFPKEPQTGLPAVPEEIRASDVARNAQYDWTTVQGREGRYTLDYLYELGKIMTVPAAYQALFTEQDAVAIGDNWRVENGLHRSLTLRTLGPRFVTRRGMDRWIPVQHDIVPKPSVG